MTDMSYWDNIWGHDNLSAQKLRDEVEAEEASIRCQHILRYMVENGIDPSGSKTIEVGSGSGIYSTIMAGHGAQATALDQSNLALERVHERGQALGVKIEGISGDAMEVAEDLAGKYDMAMSFGTVEHFHLPERFEMCRAHWELVRPGGIVVISVPNVFFLPHEILKLLLKAKGKWFLGYEGSFTPMELKKFGRDLGLDNIEMSGTDVWEDAAKYWSILRETNTWKKVFPFWLAKDGGKTREDINSDLSNARAKSLLNRYLGHDITVLGVKSSR